MGLHAAQACKRCTQALLQRPYGCPLLRNHGQQEPRMPKLPQPRVLCLKRGTLNAAQGTAGVQSRLPVWLPVTPLPARLGQGGIGLTSRNRSLRQSGI